MLSATGGALAAGAGGCALAKQRRATHAGLVAKPVRVGALKIAINGQAFDLPAYRSYRLFGIHMHGDVVREVNLPGRASGRLTELLPRVRKDASRLLVRRVL
jgi:hypothetical protein